MSSDHLFSQFGADGAVTRMFNSAVAASAISAAWELGALDVLLEEGFLDAKDFARQNALDLASTVAMFRALASVDIVRRDGMKVERADNFVAAYDARSFFHWLSRGSAQLFRQMPDVMPTNNRHASFYQRDAGAIAYACKEISEICYDPWFLKVLDTVNFDVNVVADLGCGSGARIRQLLSHFPRARALGIDIASAALSDAEADTRAVDLDDRARWIHADVLSIEPRPEFAEVELLTCFMMGHDFWPRDRCVATLQRLSEVFPNARRLILGDATRTVGVPDAELPIFNLAFEVAHDLMGTFIPTVEDWESVVDDSAWSMRQKHLIGLTVGEVIFELERA